MSAVRRGALPDGAAPAPAQRPWPRDVLLREARARRYKLTREHQARLQRMLVLLLEEAGWTSSDFLDALIQDFARRQ